MFQVHHTFGLLTPIDCALEGGGTWARFGPLQGGWYLVVDMGRLGKGGNVMGCCKCEEEFFEWKDPQPPIYIDHKEGKQYCVFHAPKDKKGLSLDSFNRRVFQLILKVKAKTNSSSTGDICNLRGTIFPGDIYFFQYNKDNPLPTINFSATTFNGNASFTHTVFGGEAKFSDAKFFGDASFVFSTFEYSVNFYDSTFFRDAIFIGSLFRNRAIFTKVKFSGVANFSGCKTSDQMVHMHELTKESLANLRFTRIEIP